MEIKSGLSWNIVFGILMVVPLLHLIGKLGDGGGPITHRRERSDVCGWGTAAHS